MITAKIVADSISAYGDRITTFELEYPRFIHAEFMTHRLFSRNAASSRAIPVERQIELIRSETAMPIHWGKNQPGMSAKEECHTLMSQHDFPEPKHTEIKAVGMLSRQGAWNRGRDLAIEVATQFMIAGYHKQIVNRLMEPYAHIKVVCTATEYDNFFYLRRHPDAQPEIQELANQMWEARQNSIPTQLRDGDWHVPYYQDGYWKRDFSRPIFVDPVVQPNRDVDGNTTEEAIAISASCCAQVSYRKLDDSLEKAKQLYQRLIESKPAHASPFEHQATPMVFSNCTQIDPFVGLQQFKGVTHLDRTGNYWSGNLRGWIQNRQLIPGHVCTEYTP
jgi:thymidylate synthase ThyX